MDKGRALPPGRATYPCGRLVHPPRLRLPPICLSCTVKIPIKSQGRSDLRITSFLHVFVLSCFSARFSRSRSLCLHLPSNNVDDDARMLKEEVEKELLEDVAMDEESENSVEAQAPESERETQASISTTPVSSRTLKMARIHIGFKVLEGSISKRPSARLRNNPFHNLVHNYGVENTSRMHIPSNWDISVQVKVMQGRKVHGGQRTWILCVQNNAIMLQCLLHKIQDLKEILLDSIKKDDKRAPSPPPSAKTKT